MPWSEQFERVDQLLRAVFVDYIREHDYKSTFLRSRCYETKRTRIRRLDELRLDVMKSFQDRVEVLRPAPGRKILSYSSSKYENARIISGTRASRKQSKCRMQSGFKFRLAADPPRHQSARVKSDDNRLVAFDLILTRSKF